MSMSEEDLRALSEARGRQVTAPTRTPETLDPALVYEARGYYGDESYINELVGNTGVGSGTLEQRQNALNILIQQGKDRSSSTDTGGNDDGGGEEDVFSPMKQ